MKFFRESKNTLGFWESKDYIVNLILKQSKFFTLLWNEEIHKRKTPLDALGEDYAYT